MRVDVAVTSCAFVACGTAAVASWLLAIGFRALQWRQTSNRFRRLADALVWLGVILAMVGWLGYAAGDWPRWSPVRAVQASGLAIAALSAHAVLARRPGDPLPTLFIDAYAILMQIYAVIIVWVGSPVGEPAGVLPAWMVARDVTALAASGVLALYVAVVMADLVMAGRERWLAHPVSSTAEHGARVEDTAIRLALVALTLSLSMAMIRGWIGWGEVVHAGQAALLIAWLLATAAFSGMVTGAAPGRLVRGLIALSFLATLVAVLGPVR
jgi:hypothetical protein